LKLLGNPILSLLPRTGKVNYRYTNIKIYQQPLTAEEVTPGTVGTVCSFEKLKNQRTKAKTAKGHHHNIKN